MFPRTMFALIVGLVVVPLQGLPRSAAAPPNVLLIVSEDNGPELGCYGDRFARTPHLDRLAERGVRFANASVPYSVCSPSRACYLTGLYPHQNGQLGLATHKYAMFQPWPNLVSLLKQHGYRTGMIGKLHVNPVGAFPLDFHALKGSNFNDRPMRKFAQLAQQFMRASDEPFFLNVNFPDAHFPLLRQQHGIPADPLDAAEVDPLPWVGVDSLRLRQYTADYYNCLARLDYGVGLLLAALEECGKSENTLIIYLGDHGAQFSRGKTSVYEAGLRIPLLICHPGQVPEGRVYRQLVSSLDVLPTILESVGIEPPQGLAGQSISALWSDSGGQWREQAVGVALGGAPVLYYPQFSIRDERFKLIVSPVRDRPNACAQAYLEHYNVHFAAGTTAEEIRAAPDHVRAAYRRYLQPPACELYDLREDPHEWRNLAGHSAFAEVQNRLRQSLREWRQQFHDPFIHLHMLTRFTREHDRLLTVDYRRDTEFQWQYLDYLRTASPVSR